MSYGRDDQNGGIERGKYMNSGPKKAADSVHPGRPSVDSNCTIPVENLEIDKKLLIDPKKLYIGSKIGEGAHGKVYEGNLRHIQNGARHVTSCAMHHGSKWTFAPRCTICR